MTTSATATLAGNIKEGIENRLRDLHTSMPGIVQSFDSVKQLVTVRPAIKRVFESNEILIPTDLPILINVPVVFPRGGGFSLTFPIIKGDECLLIFSERSIDQWHNTGEVNTPTARRFHSLSDAIAFVGLSSLPNKISNYSNDSVSLKKDDDSISISLDNNNTVNIKGNTYIEGIVTVSEAIISNNIEGIESLTVNGVEMKEHVHIGSESVPSPNIKELSNTGIPVVP